MEENKNNEEMFTSDEVDFIVKEVRDYQSNIGILIAVAVMGLLFLKDYFLR
jgi:hypothetical protein